jgi:hypothetical protein
MKCIPIFFLILISGYSSAQCHPDTSKIYEMYEVDSVASYNGNLLSALAHELKYKEYMGCFQGSVFLLLIINDKGILTSVTVKKSVMTAMAEEAIRAVKTLPDGWKPAKCGSIPVTSRMTLPIKFGFK